eukprot:5854045-Alexandrium_andersonii.AAC.1
MHSKALATSGGWPGPDPLSVLTLPRRWPRRHQERRRLRRCRKFLRCPASLGARGPRPRADDGSPASASGGGAG